jgi:hypothetical protein
MTHNASAGVDGSRKRVYTHNMCRLIIPGTVLAPVRGRYFIPRVVERASGRKDLHSGESQFTSTIPLGRVILRLGIG